MILAVLVWLAAGSSYPAHRAEDLFQHRHFQESLSALPNDDHSETSQFLRARNYFLLDDLKQATELLTALTEVHSDNSEYFDWLGKVYGRRAETANPLSAPGYAVKAKNAFEESVRLNPNNKDALSDLFDYYLSAPGFLGGGVDKAEEIASRSTTVDPPEALYEKARIAEKRKNFASAEAYLRQAMAVAPHAPSYTIALADLLAQQQHLRDADQLAERTIQQYPDRPAILFKYANLLVKQKREPGKATQLLQQYLQASLTADDPSPEEARKLLKQISN